jgi:DinB superfamily
LDCAECGFSYEALSVPEALDALRGFGKRYRIPLTRGLKGEDLDALLRAHPLPDTWSALEYACHARDVFSVQRERLGHALVEEGYTPPPMRRDDRVSELKYNEQPPPDVADDIAANATALASFVENFADADFARTMRYGYPELAERPLSWVVVHTVHEGEHHLLDIGRVLRAARGR